MFLVHPSEIARWEARIRWLEGECTRLHENISEKADQLAVLQARYDRLKAELGMQPNTRCCR